MLLLMNSLRGKLKDTCLFWSNLFSPKRINKYRKCKSKENALLTGEVLSL